MMKIRDADLKKIIGQLLRYGVLSASVIVLTGGIVYLVRQKGQKKRQKDRIRQTAQIIRQNKK